MAQNKSKFELTYDDIRNLLDSKDNEKFDFTDARDFLDPKTLTHKKAARFSDDYLHDPFFESKLAYEYFKGNVPYISQKPNPVDYGLPQDVKTAVRKDETDRKKSNDKKQIIITIVTLIVLTVLYICFLNGRKFSFGLSYANTGVFGATLLMLIPSLVVSSLICKVFPESNKDSLRPRYDHYKMDLLAYKYWQQQRDIQYWENIDGHEFEKVVASIYRKQGYQAVVSKAGGDGGIDIILTKGERRIAVQCKAHNKPVGPSVARDLYGTMTGQGYKEGILVSTHGFTKGVYDFVKDKPISLVSLSDLLQMVK